jgi:hypothetical protein
MPDAKPLLVVLHISDVHFSDRLAGDDADQMSSKVPPFLATFQHLDGLLGHHYKALSALHEFCCDLLDDEFSERLLILSGDVTASGAPAQFDLSDGFIGAASSHSAYKIGLGWSTWPNWSIPGNHDQWPGNAWPVGKPSPGLRKYFAGSFPAIGQPIPLQNGSSVRFIFVDTDADVGPWSINRVLARGDFVSQLAALDQMLPPIQHNEFRVMVIHHSIAASATQSGNNIVDFPRPDPGHRRTLEITPRTLLVLEHALVDHDIKVVLCGHLHVARLTRMMASNGNERSLILEARCGSTTQVDKYPYKVLQAMNRSRKLAPNTLIVHEVVENEGLTVWRSQIYWRARDNRFVNHHRHVSSLLPESLTSEITLLPRT